LVLALAAVVAAMRQIRQPETIEKLDRVFQTPAVSAVAVVPAAPAPHFDLSGIEDNTYFRPEEQKTWFEMFARLREMDEARLAAMSLGELTYAQLLQQPDVYRGQVVTLRGTVLREEKQHPDQNASGITEYHRLWLRPRGRGQWPFVVYSLALPEGFPRGEGLRAEVSVTGLFFKNWSYPYDGGMGLAPVVLAKNFAWQRPPAPVPRKGVDLRDVVWVATGAALFALATVWLAVRRTVRRPRRDTRLRESISLTTDWPADTRRGE
jgi:hypothetical protein